MFPLVYMVQRSQSLWSSPSPSHHSAVFYGTIFGGSTLLIIALVVVLVIVLRRSHSLASPPSPPSPSASPATTATVASITTPTATVDPLQDFAQSPQFTMVTGYGPSQADIQGYLAASRNDLPAQEQLVDATNIAIGRAWKNSTPGWRTWRFLRPAQAVALDALATHTAHTPCFGLVNGVAWYAPNKDMVLSRFQGGTGVAYFPL